MAKNVVVSLSGGMDSSTLLLRCLSEYDNVTALSFDYGQKHRVELERAQSLINYVNENGQNVNYQVIKLDGLVNLLESNLVDGGDDVPEGHYEEENMVATVVPNRNKIFASITQAVALSIANKTGEECDIALGIHAGDHAIYPDCRQEFRDADDEAFRIGNWNSETVGYFTPYLETDKFGFYKMDKNWLKIWELILMRYIGVLILLINLFLAGIAIINPLVQWRGLKHLLNWVWTILYNTRMKLDLLIMKLRENTLKNY